MEGAVREPALGLLEELTSKQQHDIGRLAQLGEVFAREAAHVMVDDADALIDTLLFRGIIATIAAPPRALPGGESFHPLLGFTHPLLHWHLLESRKIEVERLVRAIADCPLYSVVPFQLLADRKWHAVEIDGAVAVRAFDRAFDALKAIDRSAEWRRARLTWRTALRLMTARLGAWSRRDWERMLVKVINYALSLALRDHHDQMERWLAILKSLTAVISSDELAMGRLHMLTYSDLLYSNGLPAVTQELWEEAEVMLEARPHLRYSFAYTDFVIAACMDAYHNGDSEMRRRLRERAEELLGSDELPDNVRAAFARKVYPPLLSLFETEAELQRSLARIRKYESTIEANDFNVWMFCIELLAEVAEVEMLMRICNRVLPQLYEFNLIDQFLSVIVRQQWVRAGIDASFASIAEPFEQAIIMMLPERRAQVEPVLALPLVEAALLRGEPAEATAIMNTHGVSRRDLTALPLIALVLYDANPAAELRDARARMEAVNNLAGVEVASLVDLVAGASDAIDPASIHALNDRPILRLTDVLRVRVAVGLFNLFRPGSVIDSRMSELEGALRGAVQRALGWLGAPTRSLVVFMNCLLDDACGLLDTDSVAGWKERILDCIADRADMHTQPEARRWWITMLESVTVTRSDGSLDDAVPGRECRMLAVMVLDLLQRRPLSPEEFYRIAVPSVEDTAEGRAKARRIVKQSVHRLRRRFSYEIVDTNGDRPRLNTDIVDVDILEVRRLMKRSMQALLEKSPMLAAVAFFEVMSYVVEFENNDRAGNIIRRNQLFQDFQEDLFLHQREQLEIELRRNAFAVTTAFRHEKMYADESRVLQAALDAFPCDEELMECLCEAYARAGRPLDAERIRRMMEECRRREWEEREER
ncbi:MAG: hypothetical protein JST22_15275 [Bacteroidetes bacterium]|nr:hypothetical protein [Bacteroidota bacterium]